MIWPPRSEIKRAEKSRPAVTVGVFGEQEMHVSIDFSVPRAAKYQK